MKMMLNMKNNKLLDLVKSNFLDFAKLFKISKKRQGKAVIKGKMEGVIAGARVVVITSSGSLHGSIEANNLDIFGEVKGNVKVNKLKIHSAGKLHYYKANYDDLNMEDGAVLSHVGDNKFKKFILANEIIDGECLNIKIKKEDISLPEKNLIPTASIKVSFHRSV